MSLVPMMVPKTTAETLKHKINPSLELAAPQAVDVLLYTPGKRHTKTLAHTQTHKLLLSEARIQALPSAFRLLLKWKSIMFLSQGSFTIQSFNCDINTHTHTHTD